MQLLKQQDRKIWFNWCLFLCLWTIKYKYISHTYIHTQPLLTAIIKSHNKPIHNPPGTPSSQKYTPTEFPSILFPATKQNHHAPIGSNRTPWPPNLFNCPSAASNNTEGSAPGTIQLSPRPFPGEPVCPAGTGNSLAAGKEAQISSFSGSWRDLRHFSQY